MTSRTGSTRARERARHHVRSGRLEATLLQELGLLLREAADPGLAQVSPLSVELSADAGHALVPYVLLTAERDGETLRRRASLGALERATPFLRSRLAASLSLKRVPTLGFRFVGLADPEVAHEA